MAKQEHITERPVYQEICKQLDTYTGQDKTQSYHDTRKLFWYLSDEDFSDAYAAWEKIA